MRDIIDDANYKRIDELERELVEARECLRYLQDHDIYDTLTRHDKAKIAKALGEDKQ